MMLAIAASHPLWMVQRWLERYGEADTVKLLAAKTGAPPEALGFSMGPRQ